MNRRRLLTTCTLVLCTLATTPALLAQVVSPATSPATSTTHHVVFALTSGDAADWNLTLGNMRNLLTGFGTDPYEVELVAFGPGLSILKTGSIVAADIAALQAKHVTFMACENSMRMQKVTIADLLPSVQPVPSGIVEVVSKQEKGWVYIKGGR
jgi:intracellular sulfur oxidation DsrE/DsrF family protein